MLAYKKNVFKIGDLKVVRECDVIMDEEFKVQVKKLLDLWLVVTIPPVFYKIVLVLTNDFNREILAMHV